MIGVAQVIGMKPILRSFFSGAPCAKHFSRCLQREELRDRRERGGSTDGFQECAPRSVLREHRADHGGCHHAFIAALFAFRLNALHPDRTLMFSGTRMPAAGASS